MHYSSNFKRLLYLTTAHILHIHRRINWSTRSTSLGLTELIEEISNFRIQHNKRYAVLVFIDLKEAIDAINHEILINGDAVESGAAVI